jgi:hypothetical protein
LGGRARYPLQVRSAAADSGFSFLSLPRVVGGILDSYVWSFDVK